MPDINDPVRTQAKRARADKLIEAAQFEIRNRWTGRSWSDVMTSVYTNAKGWATSMDGLKMTVNMVTGGMVDRVTSLTGLDKVGEHWSKDMLAQVWALLEDDLKGQAQKIAEDYGVNQARGKISELWSHVSGRVPAQDCDEIMGKSEEIKMRFAELHLRAATVKKIMQKGTFRYCDDVHSAARELAHAELCRAEVIQNCSELTALLKTISDAAEAALPNAQANKDALKQAAERIVEDTSSVQHKMHQNFGMVGALWNARTAYSTISGSCSKEKCFGPKP